METRFNTVWLIDDNEIDNFINKKILAKNNYANRIIDFNSALSAENKINELLANGEKESVPDVVFLDLNMPVYSGTDFMKNSEQKLLTLNPNLKVVILTSSINPNDEFITSLFTTFSAFLNKPLTNENVQQLYLK